MDTRKNIIDIINKLKTIDYINDTPKVVCDLLDQIMRKRWFLFLATKIPPNGFIYRSRLVDDSQLSTIGKISDVSYVPAEYNNSFQRASTPITTMFYGVYANNAQDALLGCLAETCDCLRDPNPEPRNYKVIISKWRVLDELILPVFPNFDNNNKSLLLSGKAEEYRAKIYNCKECDNDIIEFLKFINKEFSKEVQNENEYWISSLFTTLVLFLKKEYDGVIYESRQCISPDLPEVDCIALKPNSVDCKLKLENAKLYDFDFTSIGTPIKLSDPKTLNLR